MPVAKAALANAREREPKHDPNHYNDTHQYSHHKSEHYTYHHHYCDYISYDHNNANDNDTDIYTNIHRVLIASINDVPMTSVNDVRITSVYGTTTSPLSSCPCV